MKPSGGGFAGISPERLMSQVENTAKWALPGPSDTKALGYRRVLAKGRERSHDPRDPELRRAYLELLLAAHFSTVATFVPTDVDSHIRHHAWQRISSSDDLRMSVGLIEAAAVWDAREVSARWVNLWEGAGLSGHAGEWMAVRAGGLLRAMQLGCEDVEGALCASLDAEITRHAEAFAWATSKRHGEAGTALRVAATLSHNLGDLSRVIDSWEIDTARSRELRARYQALGGAGDARFEGIFTVAGRLNKMLMAKENPRFLPLREARALRSHRGLLLPLGPFFDRWGDAVARHPELDEKARASVLTALLVCHLEDGDQQGCLRAIVGMDEALKGGVQSLARELPARLRKLLGAGAVREALRVSREHFEARMIKKYLTVMP